MFHEAERPVFRAIFHPRTRCGVHARNRGVRLRVSISFSAVATYFGCNPLVDMQLGIREFRGLECPFVNQPNPQITNTKIVTLAKTYWAWRRLWFVSTMAFMAFGLVYILFLKQDMWTAAQGLMVRDEANGAVMRLGRFQSQTEMKAAQETILEMARNPQVLREALLEIGPEKKLFSFGTASKDWPTQTDLADLADEAVGVRAPKGAEFGTTEVIYLDIKQASKDRALALNRAVCKALDNRLKLVRVARADGVIAEIIRASDLASDELRRATEALQLVEREAGADLSDLRGLSEATGNGSTSRQQLDAVKTELRQIENVHSELLTDYNLLRETQDSPERLLSAPASILSAHPGLRKLREGLADAQLATSQLRGRFTGAHPLVYVATTSEREIKSQLHAELSVALATTEKNVANSQARIDNLKLQQTQLEERLTRLARIRADYENLTNEARSRTKILQDIERQLAEAQASRDAALSTSLLTRLDEPVLGERPIGPGRTTILAGMTLAGLFFGLGIVFLLTPLDSENPNTNRWNEALGRRLSDRFPWLADTQGNNGQRRRRSDYDRRGYSRASDRGEQPMMTPSQQSAIAPQPSVSQPISTFNGTFPPATTNAEAPHSQPAASQTIAASSTNSHEAIQPATQTIGQRLIHEMTNGNFAQPSSSMASDLTTSLNSDLTVNDFSAQSHRMAPASTMPTHSMSEAAQLSKPQMPGPSVSSNTSSTSVRAETHLRTASSIEAQATGTKQSAQTSNPSEQLAKVAPRKIVATQNNSAPQDSSASKMTSMAAASALPPGMNKARDFINPLTNPASNESSKSMASSSAPLKSEPHKNEPTNNDPAKNDPAKNDATKGEPTKPRLARNMFKPNAQGNADPQSPRPVSPPVAPPIAPVPMDNTFPIANAGGNADAGSLDPLAGINLGAMPPVNRFEPR